MTPSPFWLKLARGEARLHPEFYRRDRKLGPSILAGTITADDLARLDVEQLSLDEWATLQEYIEAAGYRIDDIWPQKDNDR